MEYGFCTGFATKKLFEIDLSLLPKISEAGFDFVEYPLMSLAALSDSAFDEVCRKTKANKLSCTSMCNFFPGSLSLYISSEDELDSYIGKAFDRAESLGAKKIIFGSGAFRSYPESLSREKAYEMLVSFCINKVAPSAEKRKISVLIEPLRRGECNIINTIREGADLVEDVSNPFFGLMIDMFHMESNGENVSDIDRLFPQIEHVHICNPERELPVNKFSDYLCEGLGILKARGYNKAISFESLDSPCCKEALAFLKSFISPESPVRDALYG